MSEQIIIGYHVVATLTWLWLMFMWSTDGALNCLMKVFLFCLFATSATILATWLNIVKIVD